jgi:predicted RNase H-like nuclease (RuvC/YqgF family)
MSQMTSIAQGYHRNINRQINQIEELQVMITAKDEVIAQWNETIIHREDQIVESDTLIIQHNTVIEFLQEEVHDLTIELDDAIAHIDMLHEQLAPPVAPKSLKVKMKKKTRKRLKEFPILIPSMEIPNLILSPNVLLMAASRLWATSTISSLFQIVDLLDAHSVV